ncbi:hypothetical protein ANANG_G00128330 [Anguilla anguilla]|uniref:Uncharacterized protein n=1 Tax=Anguilla anguilla TaxID=7936 RepID=A0A9D3MK46_ANGAN|nr:hypothetical protein ANANG_G00128330 [Anguilla anguilla]
MEGHGRQPHIWNPGISMPLQRTVTFNLTGSDAHMITAPKKKSLKVEGHKVRSSDVQKRKEKYRLSNEKASKSSKREKGPHLKRHKQRVQWSNGLLKVKLNLNPFRKNRVHPKEHLKQEDVQSELERAGTEAKKSKLSSKDRKILIKHSMDNHAVSERKRRSSKVSKTDHADHAKKLSQTTSTKQSHDLSIQRVKSSRPKASRKIDRVKHSKQESRDFEAVDQEISESHSLQRKRTKKRRQQDLSLEDDAREYEANLVKSQEENSLSLSKSSKRGKNSRKTDGNNQESSAELEGKRQPQTVNVTHQTSVKDDSNDETRTLELKAEEPLASCGVAMLQEMAPKEVSNEDQPANLELREGEETRLAQGGTSLATEKLHRTDVTEESLRPSPNSSVLQTQVHSPDVSPTQEAQRAHMLDLGDALVEQKPQHTENGKTESIHEEDQSVIQEQTAFTADESGKELANTMSVEGGTKQSSSDSVDSVRPTPGDQDEQHILEGGLGQEELKPLSDQGSTDMLPNQESEGKIMDTLTVEEEPKKENAPLLDTLQGDNSDGAMVTEVPGTSPQAIAGPAPALPQSLSTEPLAHAETGGSSLGDSLAAPDSQPVPDTSDQTTMGGPGPTSLLDEENLSNNNSMTPDSPHPIIIQEYLSSAGGSPKRKLRLILPERPRSRPITPLDRKIR